MTPIAAGRRRTFWEIFFWPLVLCILSSIGLVAALVGDGPYDWLSWITLGMPLLVSSWCVRPKPSAVSG